MARVVLSASHEGPGVRKGVGDLNSIPDGNKWIILALFTDCWCYPRRDFVGDPIHFHNGRDTELTESVEDMTVVSIRVRLSPRDSKIGQDQGTRILRREIREDQRAKIEARSKEYHQGHNAYGHFQAVYCRRAGTAILAREPLPSPMKRMQEGPVIGEGPTWERLRWCSDSCASGR
jgi:hypothetical protein